MSWVITRHEVLQYTLLIPLVLAVFVLPRKLPEKWRERIGGDPAKMHEVVRMNRWLSSIRAIYIVVAVFIMLGLPEILY